MQLCLTSLMHLLVFVAVVDIALGSYLPSFLKTVSSRPNIERLRSIANILKNNNKILQNKQENSFLSKRSRILQYPPDFVEVAVGSRVELHCVVFGNPPPQVYWLTGNEQEKELIAQTREARSSVPSTQWEFSKVSSTYVIDCVKPEDQGLKFCMSVSNNIQMAATALLVNSTKTAECNEKTQPTITLYNNWRMALEGVTVILPCRAVGQPKPYLFWVDNDNEIINPATHDRHVVLPNGDLQITNIQWSDMGRYTCKVKSGYTEKSISTFLYPAVKEKKDE